MSLLLLLACGPDPDVVVEGLVSENPAVREDVVTLARKVEDELVVEALLAVLEDPSPEIRRGAIEALAEQGVIEAVPAIAERVQDRNPEVQTAAIQALGRLGDPGGVEELMRIARQQRRLDAIWALGEIGDARALPLLARLAEEEDEYVAWNAQVALRAIGTAVEEPEEPEEELVEEEAPAEEEAAEVAPEQPVDMKQKDEKPVERKVAWPPGG